MTENGTSILCTPPPRPQTSSDSWDDPFLLDHLIYSGAMPVVCSSGVIAAAVCVLVFTRPQMRSSLNIYLAGLSFFDLLLLAMSLLIYPPMSICLRKQQGLVCQFFWKTALVTYPVSLAAQTASVWTCVAITVDRFLAVQYPLKRRLWCTPTKALLVLSIIAIVSFFYKMPSVFEVDLDECGRLVPTDLRQNALYIVIYNTYGYLLLLIVIPWTIMIILNVIVVRAVHQAYKLRQNMTMSQRRVDDREGRCTVMALVMLSTFIVFNLLAGLNNVIEAFTVYHQYYRFRIPIGNLLVCVNSASNILIYSIFGRKFRHMCISLLFPCLLHRGYHWLQPTAALHSEVNDICRKVSYPHSRGSSLRLVHAKHSNASSTIEIREK